MPAWRADDPGAARHVVADRERRRGRVRFPASAGARRSCGAITSSSRPVVNTAQQEPPKPGFYLGDWPASPAPHRWMVYDIDFQTGKVRWEREVSSAPPGKAKHLKNSYASETAVTDGERVYFYFANAGLFAFDFAGKPVWSKPIGPFKTRNNWGTGASPVLHGDRIYIVNDNDEQSFLAAYDTRTGAEVWRVESQGGHELVVAVRLGERRSAPRS